MEDYKSKYEDSLSRAKVVYLTDDDKKSTIEFVFPELMELDKEEEIRQALIKYFTLWSKDTSHTWGIKNEDIIDWLKRVKSVRVKSAKVTTGKLAEMIEQKALEDFKRINPWTFTVGLNHQEVTKKSEQDKWSEEDEVMLNGIIDDFGDGKTSNMLQESWLKSIKDRVHPKPQWTEEDEDVCRLISNKFVKSVIVSSEELDRVLDWFESLKQRLQQ